MKKPRVKFEVVSRGPIMCESCNHENQVRGEWKDDGFHQASGMCEKCEAKVVAKQFSDADSLESSTSGLRVFDGIDRQVASNPTMPAEDPTRPIPLPADPRCEVDVAMVVNNAEPPQEAPASPEPRPSLEVAIETHKNLQKRVEALCLRLAGWDLRVIDPTIAACFTGNLKGLLEFWNEVGAQLAAMQRDGFVAKSTAKSRMEARLASGLPVRLSEAKRKLYSYAYTAEELEQVEVVGRADDGTIWVKLGRRESVMPIPLKLSDLETP